MKVDVKYVQRFNVRLQDSSICRERFTPMALFTGTIVNPTYALHWLTLDKEGENIYIYI